MMIFVLLPSADRRSAASEDRCSASTRSSDSAWAVHIWGARRLDSIDNAEGRVGPTPSRCDES